MLLVCAVYLHLSTPTRIQTAKQKQYTVALGSVKQGGLLARWLESYQ